MIKKLIRSHLVIVLLVSSSACARPSYIDTPEKRALYSADQIISSLGIFQDAAIGAHSQGLLSESSTRLIVNFVKSSVIVIAASPQVGWRTTVSMSIDELRKNLPPEDAAKYETYLKLLQSMIVTL